MRLSVPILRGEEGILWAVGLRPGEACRVREGEEAKLVTFLGRGDAFCGAGDMQKV